MVELITSHFKEFGTINNDMSKMLKDLVTIAGERATTEKDVVHLRDEEWAHQLMM